MLTVTLPKGKGVSGLAIISSDTCVVTASNLDSNTTSLTPGGTFIIIIITIIIIIIIFTFLYLWGLMTVTWWPRLASSSPTSITPICS